MTSSITSLLLILLFLHPFRSDWAIKRITPKGISNRGFSVHAPSSEAATKCVEYVVMINDTLTTKHYPAADWIIISLTNIATFYKIANFFAFYLIFSYICIVKAEG